MIRIISSYEVKQLIGIVPLHLYFNRRFGLPFVYFSFPRHQVIDLADVVLHREKQHVDLFDAVLRHISQERLFRWDVLDLSLFLTRSSTYALIGKSALTAHRSAFEIGSAHV